MPIPHFVKGDSLSEGRRGEQGETGAFSRGAPFPQNPYTKENIPVLLSSGVQSPPTFGPSHQLSRDPSNPCTCTTYRFLGEEKQKYFLHAIIFATMQIHILSCHSRPLGRTAFLRTKNQSSGHWLARGLGDHHLVNYLDP